MSKALHEVVSVNAQFLRSVRIDSDLDREDALNGYVLQPSVRALVQTLEVQLTNSQQRAFTWTGPYGVGKSSLALAIASLASKSSSIRKAAASVLELASDSGLSRFFRSRDPWAVLPLVGRRASLIDDLAAALDRHVPTKGRKPYSENGQRNVVAEIIRAAEGRSSRPLGGVILVIDELGKYLENAAETGEDIGWLQDLAEQASRTSGKVVVVGILHQSFSQYAARLPRAAQDEWAKIQGRFVDIPLVSASDEVLSLVGKALKTDQAHKNSISISKVIAESIRKRRAGAAADLATILDKCWPLHPVTAALLGPASKRRFAQNERSIFSFLSSAEPNGFVEHLNKTALDGQPYYVPSQLWDYLRANFEPAILASTDSHKWATACDAIERTEARFGQLHVDLVKTIALLELLRNGSGLVAEDQLLQACVMQERTKVTEALQDLSRASVLVYRNHAASWALFAGSDFDFDAELNAARSQLTGLSTLFMRTAKDLPNINARKHYAQTGALRYFSRSIEYISSLTRATEDFRPSTTHCGQFILVLHSEETHKEHVLREIKQASERVAHKGIALGMVGDPRRMVELAEELLTIESVRKNSKRLHGDAVAFREVSAREAVASAAYGLCVNEAFEHASWYFAGKPVFEAQERISLSRVASNIASSIYPQSLCIQSELVNRDILSSSAAKAQRELLHAMLTNQYVENLGFEGFPAEAGLYYTTVKALGLHRSQEEKWGFYAPKAHAEPCLKALWQRTEELVFSGQEAKGLGDVYSLWASPPFGIKAGLFPILALAFFLANRPKLSLRIENTFIPEVTDAHIDEWLQDPGRVSWGYIQLKGGENALLASLSSELSMQLNLSVGPTPLDAARALVGVIFGLPTWTRRTETVSEGASKVRALLLKARDPHQVLFNDLPALLEQESGTQISHRIVGLVRELVDAYPNRLGGIKERLFHALDHEGQLSHLRIRAERVLQLGSEFKLEAFAVRIASVDESIQAIEGLLMLALGKPSKDWTDHDLNEGEMRLIKWALDFRTMETLALYKGKPIDRRALAVVFGATQTVATTVDISEKDAEKARHIARDILSEFGRRNYKREVIIAALAEMGAALQDENEHPSRVGL